MMWPVGWEALEQWGVYAARIEPSLAEIPTTDGRLFTDGLVVMTWMEGGPPGTEADWRRVADTLRRLHRLTQGFPQHPGWRSSADPLHAETGGKIVLGAMPREGVARCRAAWARLAECRTCVVRGNLNNPGSGFRPDAFPIVGQELPSSPTFRDWEPKKQAAAPLRSKEHGRPSSGPETRPISTSQYMSPILGTIQQGSGYVVEMPQLQRITPSHHDSEGPSEYPLFRRLCR